MTGLEAIHLSLSSMEKHLGDAAEAIAAQADAQQGMAERLVEIDELKDLMRTMAGKLGELFDQQRLLHDRIGAYISDAAKQTSSVRKVDERVRKLEDKLSG